MCLYVFVDVCERFFVLFIYLKGQNLISFTVTVVLLVLIRDGMTLV